MGRTDKDGITHDYQSAAPLSSVTGAPNSYSASKDGVTAWGDTPEEAEASLREQLGE